jgi:hypothetical protein
LHGRLIAREAYCTGGFLNGRLFARDAYDWVHFVRDAFCPGGILRVALDWVLFDQEAFDRVIFVWKHMTMCF